MTVRLEERLPSLAPAEIIGSPDWLPTRISDSGRHIVFGNISDIIYREEAFLDERIEAKVPTWGYCGVDEIEYMLWEYESKLDFIFHIGHAGSTLLSRALGHYPAIFSVREPAILRALTALPAARQTSRNRWLAIILKLLARTYESHQKILLKTTSFVSEIGGEMARLASGSRRLMLRVRPQIYIASILVGEATRAELQAVSASRAMRLSRRLAVDGVCCVQTLSLGELAALGWIVEILSLAAVDSEDPNGESMWLDFDDILADRAGEVGRILKFLDPFAGLSDVNAILAADDWSRYSKAREHEFTEASRRELIERGRLTYAAEIRRGLDWINRLVDGHPTIRADLERIAAARR